MVFSVKIGSCKWLFVIVVLLFSLDTVLLKVAAIVAVFQALS